MGTMNNEHDSKWTAKMFFSWAICIDLLVLLCLIVMSLRSLFQRIYLITIGWFCAMSSIFRGWKNRLRCSSKRYMHRSRSSMLMDTEIKAVNMTMEKLQNENRVLKDRFDKLEARCQQWIADEQIYLLKRIEQLEEENHRLRENYRAYQIQSEKCLGSVTDLIIKTLFTQEELRKQCNNLHQAIDTVKLRKKKSSLTDDAISSPKRANSCQFTSNQSNDHTHQNRHSTNDQSTWLHQQLMIVEENDHPMELHISESQSSVYSPTMAAATAASKYKSRIPSAGLANELYFASHKPDGDNEKTTPVLLRDKRRAPQSPLVPTDTTPTSRRPISSPVRSNTYVLQQHNRVNNNNNNSANNHQINSINRKRTSPVRANQSSPSPSTPMALNRNRQAQQQRTYSNHERLPTPATATVESSATAPVTTHQQFAPRVHTPLASRRPAPIVKNTPVKVTTPNIPRPPRIPATPPVRLSRPSPTIPSRSPRTPIRPSNVIVTPKQTISSSPTTPRSARPRYTLSKSPEPLRPVTGTVNRPRPAHTLVNKSRMGSANTTASPIKTPTTVIGQQPTTARVSDLDTLMARKQPTAQSPRAVDSRTSTKPSIISPSPVTDTIRRSLFSTNAVKHVRPVRSQELKIFSCHLTTDSPSHSVISDDVSTHSLLTECKTDQVSREEPIPEINDDGLSNTLAVTREISEDSLNEHHHIKQLLESNASIPAIHNESSSNEDLATSPAVTSWSRIRSSCESNLSQVPPLPSELSASPAFYHGPIRQENIHMASDGRYFLLFDDNPTSEGSPLSHGATPTSSPSSSSSSSSSASALISPLVPTGRKSLVHRLVFPERLGRVLFFRRTLSDSDIYQKLCSKDNEIDHNVYHLDTVRDYSMEFYMLTTYASDSQLRAWVDNSYDDNANGTYYFDDQRFDSSEDEDDDEHGDESRRNRMHSSDSILREDEFHRLQADEELDWYSELESFNLMPQQQQWKHENGSSCSSEDHVGELLRAEQFSVSSLTTTTSAESSSSAGLISTSWPLANGAHYPLHSTRSSQSLGSPPSSNLDEQSQTIIKEILTYPWTNQMAHGSLNPPEIDPDQLDHARSSSVVADQFQPDFYYLCPLKNTVSFLKTDEKSNGIHRQLSHDV